jgi:hypothetical protein
VRLEGNVARVRRDLKERGKFEVLNEDERVKLKLILKKCDWMESTGLMRLRMGTSGGLLCKR